MSWTPLFKSLTTSAKRFRRVAEQVATKYGTHDRFTSVPDGAEEITYTVNIDHAELAQLAIKAASNKSQQSTDGPIQVVIVSRRRIGGAA
jgi:hypothetical protein